MDCGFLILQKRPARAGAQTSLARLVGPEALGDLRPSLLAGSEGWLTETLRARGLPVVVTDFPSSRSLSARLMGLRGFARRVVRSLEEAEITPRMIIANDHQECPLALAVAAALGGVPTLGLLRSAGMDANDFQKYRCADCDGLLTVGEDLQRRVEQWGGRRPILMDEGFSETDVHPLVELPKRFPSRLLVVGTSSPAKGFSDFVKALDLIEARHPEFPAIECDFTSEMPADSRALFTKPRRARLRFLGRADDFASLARTYSLIVHPSRAETFGMAPIEAILAGVPVLVSATGIVPRLSLPDSWRFSPGKPVEIAERLVDLWRNWSATVPHLEVVRREVREAFFVGTTSLPLRREIERLGGEPETSRTEL